MPWNKNDYPSSMKNLPDKQRDKAIEIANALLTDGYEEGRAIPIAISTSEIWANNRAAILSSKEREKGNKPIKGKKELLYHLVYKDNKWIIRKVGAKRHSFAFDTKNEALEKAEELLEKKPSRFIIHRKDGTFEKSL